MLQKNISFLIIYFIFNRETRSITIKTEFPVVFQNTNYFNVSYNIVILAKLLLQVSLLNFIFLNWVERKCVNIFRSFNNLCSFASGILKFTF